MGSWPSQHSPTYLDFTVDSDGNIGFSREYFYGREYYYKGKLNDTFDYPYTVEISIEGYRNFNDNIYTKEHHTGTITFSSSSNATATWEAMTYGYKWEKITMNNFEKQRK